MHPIRMPTLIAATALLLAGTGDRLPPLHAGGGAPAESSAPAGLPRFALFGWASPPAAFGDSARYAEMALAGLNLALPAFDDTGGLASLGPEQLDQARANGLRVLVWDDRFTVLLDPGTDRDAVLDAVTHDYRDHPALAGYYLGDEPQPDLYPLLADLHAGLEARDPAHPGWNNLLGRAAYPSADALESELRTYADAVGPAVLCDAQYDFAEQGDRGQFFENLTRLAAVAHERGLPFWSIVQLVRHRGFRAITEGELRWQVSHLLAYGARGVGYFTYWTPADTVWNWAPAVIDVDGARTPWFDVLAAFNPWVRAAGETLTGLAWIATGHAGSVPPGAQAFVADDWVSEVEGRAAIGQFADAAGGRWLLVANSDSLSARTIGLTLPRADSVARLSDPDGAWAVVPATPVPGGLRVGVPLEAGGFALLRVSGAAPDDGASGARPGLSLAPNPAHGDCRFVASAAVGRATLEIIDAGGRRIWARALPPGRSTVTWDGRADSGAAAPRGVYFARLHDDRGAAVRRLVWLGTR